MGSLVTDTTINPPQVKQLGVENGVVLEEILGLTGIVAGDRRKLTTAIKTAQAVFFYYSLILLVVLLLPQGTAVLKIFGLAIFVGTYLLFRIGLKRRSRGRMKEKREAIFKALKKMVVNLMKKPTTDMDEAVREIGEELSKLFIKIPLSVWVLDALREFERLLFPAVVLYFLFYKLLLIWWVEALEYLKPTTANLEAGVVGYLAATVLISLLSIDITLFEKAIRKKYRKDRLKFYASWVGFGIYYLLGPHFLFVFMFQELTEIEPKTSEYLLRYKSGTSLNKTRPVENEALEFLKVITHDYEVRPILNPEKVISDHGEMVSNIDYMFQSAAPTAVGTLRNTYVVIDNNTGRLSIIHIVLERVVEERSRFWVVMRGPKLDMKYNHFIRVSEVYFKGSIVGEVVRKISDEMDG
ncbi:hypothetical protein [Thermococcus sp. MAR1]|uniref:hypothetical protein n=1 Tax=Thermococcus sp. MAR1 TaxID=1638263 RepID=UPI001438DA7C|nr:hypothetical protein [Thermococcus sp. MAR1]NJE09344.1 hypothetical protein [Thermococcus sp. MAR1]